MEEVDDSDLTSNVFNEHLEALNRRSKQLRLVHLNTQRVVSTFDELQCTINEYPFDIIAMSELDLVKG